MKLKENIFTTLLLSIGLILHYATPGILGGMKFDFLLIFIFASILLNSKFDNIILTALLGGILSAMTTTFPGGQIPNMIDKMVTCLSMYLVINFFKKYSLNTITVGIIGAIGTLISGMTFLISALYISGLPAPMLVLVSGIVIPTAIVNTISIVVVYKALKVTVKKLGISM
ncbi:MAG: tryptophan transporter [Tissierellaceae bacterium]|nr:tryptophan transporter [Tissierellaceae bacterium]